MYNLHPSLELQKLFLDKPYQGQNPMQASILFIGLDTNYAYDIDNNDFFNIICEYHQNPINFWLKYNIHHPVLMDNYQKGKLNKDGRKYHQNFAKIGFSKDYSHKISFIELLDVPTFGVNKLCIKDLNIEHLKFINSCINQLHKKIVFVSRSVVELMKKSKIFSFINNTKNSQLLYLNTLYKDNYTKIVYYYHFSSRKNLTQQAKDIYTLIKSNSY